MRYVGKEIWGEREEQLSTGVSGYVSKEDASSRTIHFDQNMLCSTGSLTEPTNLEGGTGQVASLKSQLSTPVGPRHLLVFHMSPWTSDQSHLAASLGDIFSFRAKRKAVSF